MELSLDPCNNKYKHLCKICKKGFMCGRALGGHMRAHGIGVEDPAEVYDDEDDWEAGGDNSSGNKRMYALRANPNRTRNRACDACGKEFLSWKSFLEHGRCCGRGGSEYDEEEGDSPAASSPSFENGDRWSKRKGTFRSENGDSNFTVNDYNLANCLIMLSNAVVEPAAATSHPEGSSASAERHQINFAAAPLTSWAPPPTRGLFECKACKKVFNSHQALGGHRASHKKVKGCFAARLDPIGSDRATDIFDDQIGPKRTKGTKVHECSVCHRVFNSGQALGGHKRCHWITPANSSAAITVDPMLARFQQLQHGVQVQPQDQSGLDLNIFPGQIDPDPKKLLSLKVSTELFLKYEEINKEKMKNVAGAGKTKNNNHTNDNSFESLKAFNVDDEADSKMKMAKLSELKENVAGCSAPWLQVGIGSNNGVDL